VSGQRQDWRTAPAASTVATRNRVSHAFKKEVKAWEVSGQSHIADERQMCDRLRIYFSVSTAL